MADALSWDESVAALVALENQNVAFRIALLHRTEDLIAVFEGRLGALSRMEKQPSLFWPIGECHHSPRRAERPGIYLRRPDFVRAELRAGGIVVIEQPDVVLNVRPLA